MTAKVAVAHEFAPEHTNLAHALQTNERCLNAETLCMQSFNCISWGDFCLQVSHVNTPGTKPNGMHTAPSAHQTALIPGALHHVRGSLTL